MVQGVLGGLGSLFIEIVYIAIAIIVGINLFRRGSFYQLVKRAGEEDKTNSQAANVLGLLIYGVIAFLILLVVRSAAKKMFGI